MTLKADLEQHIRESYKLISEFQEILRLSDNPKEQARYLAEYVPLCKRLSLTMPEDVAFIASSLLPRPQPSLSADSTPFEAVASSGLGSQGYPSESSTCRETSENLERVQQEPASFSLEELKDVPKRYLWGQFLLLLLFLVSVIEGLVGIFDVPPCLRRSVLVVFTSLGGVIILCLSFLTRYRNSYHNWDRWLIFGLIVVVVGILGWLTYQECVPASPMPLL
jgi:hypothetical protein